VSGVVKNFTFVPISRDTGWSSGSWCAGEGRARSVSRAVSIACCWWGDTSAFKSNARW